MVVEASAPKYRESPLSLTLVGRRKYNDKLIARAMTVFCEGKGLQMMPPATCRNFVGSCARGKLQAPVLAIAGRGFPVGSRWLFS